MSAETCYQCGAAYKPSAAFCASCGLRRPLPEQPNELRFVIRFFIAMLAVMIPAVVYALHFDGDPFLTDVVASAGLFLVTLGFALTRRRLVWPLYARLGFSPLGYLLVLLAAPVVLALVLAYVHGLSNAFGIRAPDELETYRTHHMLIAVGLVAIAPPLVEELAFRGIIYTGLRRSLGVSESFIISSFAFALLHMSLPALITHLPLGLYFCWLRYRSASLWPAMFAHFLHNLGVIVVDHLGLA